MPEVEIQMKERVEEEEGGKIGIEKIVIGQSKESAQDADLTSYRKRFAMLLGIEEERVEVRLCG